MAKVITSERKKITFTATQLKNQLLNAIDNTILATDVASVGLSSDSSFVEIVLNEVVNGTVGTTKTIEVTLGEVATELISLVIPNTVASDIVAIENGELPSTWIIYIKKKLINSEEVEF